MSENEFETGQENDEERTLKEETFVLPQENFKDKMKKDRRKHIVKETLEWVQLIILAVVITFIIRLFVFEIIRIDGPSMENTLVQEERVFVTKVVYLFAKPRRGDVAICKYPQKKTETYVKRIIGIGGDTVEVKGGKVYLNDKEQVEPYIKEPFINNNYGPTFVPEGFVFVMGDNRNNSMDSRSVDVGLIPLSSVLGRVDAVVWPIEKVNLLPHPKS